MGSWNFYIELKANDFIIKNMLREYTENTVYQSSFYFGHIESDYEDEYKMIFVSVIDNFLPVNHLIYNFLSHYMYDKIYIKTNNIKHIFDFEKKSDFVKFMYDTWESKIDFVYDNLGVILINYKKYYKVRNKLYRKYYKKIPNTIFEIQE